MKVKAAILFRGVTIAWLQPLSQAKEREGCESGEREGCESGERVGSVE